MLNAKIEITRSQNPDSPQDCVEIATTVFSGPGGFYSASDLPEGTYRAIRCLPPDGSVLAIQWVENVTVTAGQTITKDIILPQAGTISGKVVDANNNPLQGIGLHVEAPEGHYRFCGTGTQTDSNGNYTISYAPSGVWELNVHPFENSPYAEKRISNISVSAAQITTVNITLSIAGTIKGQVVDYNAIPVQGVKIEIWSQNAENVGRSTYTDSGGNYFISGLLPGIYNGEFKPPETRTDLVRKRINDIYSVEGETFTLNITLQAGAMISGNISSWPLTGTLAEGTTGYTILAFDSDISFTLENINNLDQSAETRVNSYGGYEITVPSGTYDLYLMSFAENPYDDWDACAAHGMTGNISVTSGEVKSGINITGSIGTGLISGSVSTSDGGGISGGKDISVLMTDANNKFAGMSQINITPAYPNQGTYRIKNFAAGSYNVLVCVQGTGYLPISDTISIGLGETIKDFVISKPVATGVIAGKVTKSDGTTGISGALVEALTADGSQLIVASTTTDIDGNYSIILATGSYDVRASSFCYEHKTVYDSAVFDSSTTVVNFSLSPAPLNPPMGLYGAAKSTGSIMWQWMDNSDNEDGFWVKTVDGSQLIELEPNTTYWLETGLSPNTSYGRYVEAYNGVGIASEPYPTYKHTLAAHPSNTKITHRSSNTITIEWSANGNPEGTQYKVYHSRDAEIPEMEPMSDYVMSTTCVVGFYMPLEPSTLYYIKVKAENAEYIPSWFDSIVSTMTLSIDQPVPVIYLDGEGFDVNTGSTASWGSGADFSYTTAFGGKDIEIWNGGIKDLGPVDSDSVMIFDNTGSEPGHISPVSGNIYTFLSDDGKATKIKVTNVSVEPDKIEFIFVYDYAPVSRTSGTITGSLAYTGEQTGAYTVGVSTSYDFTGTVYGTTTAPGNTFEITGIPIILDNYYVISFVDVNGNSKPDNTEPWNVNYWYTNPGPQRISEPVSTDIGTLYLYDFGEISGHVTNTSTQTGTVLIRAEGTYTTDYSAAYEKTITADADTGNYTIFVATPSNPYKIIAWIDGNANGAQDPGEYFTETTQPLNVSADSPLTGININITGDNYTSPMPPIFFAGESVSSESIIWSWQDVSGNEDGFRVKTDTSGTIAELGSSTTYYIETGLLPNTSYSRYVEAYNMAGSSRSETASRFTLASIPINTNILQVTSNTITIGWSANGNPINTEYEIQRSLNNTDYMPIISNYTMFQYTDTDVVPATTYWYKISATNGNGIPTEFGTTISTATQNADAGPAPYIISTIPADLDTNISVNIQYIDLVFNTYVTPVDNTAIGTHLRLKNADDGTDYTSRLASFTFLAGDMYRIELTNVNLSTGTTYIVEVSNFENTNGIKMSSDSFKFTTEIVSISTGTVPDGPTELKATERTTESIKWTWKDNANNETGYQILDFNLKPDTGTINMMHPPVVTDLPENSVEWTETGLMPNTKYIRSVAAYNEFGSSNSAKVSAYTFANMPTNFVCSAKTFESLTLEWYTNNNPANTKYILKRSTDGINYSELSIPDIMPPLDSFMGLTTFIDTGLQQETTYYYLLHAVNNADGSKTNPVRLTVQTSASSSSGPIAGKVTQSNGEPITGVWVQLFTTEGTTEIEGRFTEPDGSFEFKDIADGVYMLMCSWFVNDIESVVYKTGITENTVEEIFTLEIQYQLASLYGNLTIGTRPNFAGKFAPGLQPYVELLLRSKVVAKVNTDSEGNYMIPNLLPGKYVIRAFNGIQMSEPQECDVKEGQKLAMNFKWSLGLVKDDVFAYPNPARNKKITFRYKAINASHKTRIKIYTISGELVKEIKDEQINRTAAPKYEFEWDLKNNNNREIASGVYIYIVEIKQTVEPYEKVIIKKKFAIIK
ncbi:MAG: Fibronectin type III domain protein [Elusimicrobia bacterium ADurb.Bin231]|nr:MAG: Fibronectin type III domain protein [Elusimicrobia bacterium ADurb.Bin231]